MVADRPRRGTKRRTAQAPARPRDPVTTYAAAIVAGELPAATRQIQACQRHLDDLERQGTPGFPYRFDEPTAIDHIKFFTFFRHSKGEWATLPFVLSGFQEFIIGSLFGWKRVSDGGRRFRIAYLQMPRKQGKSTLAAGLAIKGTFFDGEPGADGFIFANKRDQAIIVFQEAKAMVNASPDLRARIESLSGSLFIEATRSSLKPLGADADTLDGLNPHIAVGDELHAAKTRSMVDVVESATSARRQALIVYITTPGYDRESICFEKYGYACSILDRSVHDETVFAFIADPDESDDWRDIRAWAKANPGLGLVGRWIWAGASQDTVLARLAAMHTAALAEARNDVDLADRLVAVQLGGSVKFEDLVSKAQKAEVSPASQNTFRRYQLGQWTEQSVRAIDMTLWDACRGPKSWQEMRQGVKGRLAYPGVDLASTQDIAAVGWVLPAEDGCYDLLVDLFIPKERLSSRRERERLQAFIAAGALTATPGNVISQAFVRQRMAEMRDELREVREVGFDPWNAIEFSRELKEEDGFEVIEIRQGTKTLHEPTKKLLDLIAEKKIRHGDHPVLRWMASNFAVRTDSNANMMPDKEHSAEKIDGLSALIDAFAVEIRSQPPKRKKSPYAMRGAQVVTKDGVTDLLLPPKEPAP